MVIHLNDPFFRQAVEAIDSGNLRLLEQTIEAHPSLVAEPLEHLSGDYFNEPYLLWFVADNPIRNGKLPANIVEITAALVRAVQTHAPQTAARQLDYALGLVATGRTPKESGSQIALMDLLIDAGATPGSGLGALAHGNMAAAEHLVQRGSPLTLAVATGLGRLSDVQRLLPAATAGLSTPSAGEKLIALTVAAYYGNGPLLRYLLEAGVDPNGYPEKGSGFHEHATPLHQAVASGSLECVKLLVEAGARTDAVDHMYSGTPLEWADYLQREGDQREGQQERYRVIEEYLK